jgi:hypothetical protein
MAVDVLTKIAIDRPRAVVARRANTKDLEQLKRLLESRPG